MAGLANKVAFITGGAKGEVDQCTNHCVRANIVSLSQLRRDLPQPPTTLPARKPSTFLPGLLLSCQFLPIPAA